MVEESEFSQWADYRNAVCLDCKYCCKCGLVHDGYICWDCARQRLATAEAAYAKAAASYGGICRTLDESGRHNTELEVRINLLESALRGEQGIEFDDGYSVNVAELTARLAAAEALLREAVEQFTDACVVASEDGKCSKEYGVAIVGAAWFERAKGACDADSGS